MQKVLHPGLSVNSARRSHYVPALTGLRAIAAYLVFLHHYNPASSGTLAHRLVEQGYIGVSMFFVLSGFLIHYRYADAYLTHITWSWRTYLQNRFARIFPLYALLLLITVSVNTILGRPMSLPLFGLNLTLLKGFFEDVKFSGIAQSWSLTVEVCFYLSAPYLFVYLQRWGALWLTAGLVGIGLLIWTAVGRMPWYECSGSLSFMLFYTFFGRVFEFIVGMWLARCWCQKRLPVYRFATFRGMVLLGGCVFWQASVGLFTTNPTELLWSEVAVYNYVLPIGIGVVLLGILREKSGLRYVLSHPVFQALGQSSYAFYLIHIGVVATGLQKVGVTSTWLLFGLLVLIAHGLYILAEKPLQGCLRSY